MDKLHEKIWSKLTDNSRIFSDSTLKKANSICNDQQSILISAQNNIHYKSR